MKAVGIVYMLTVGLSGEQVSLALCKYDENLGIGGWYRFAVPADPPRLYYTGQCHRASLRTRSAIGSKTLGLDEMIPARKATSAPMYTLRRVILVIPLVVEKVRVAA